MKSSFLLMALASFALAGSDQPLAKTALPDGRALLEQTLNAPVPASLGAVYDVVHTDQHGQKRSRRALLFFGVDPKDPLVRKQLVTFLEPADLKGNALLTENRMGWGQDYSAKSWIYNPLFRRSKLNSISNWRNRQFGSSMNVFDGLHHDLDWYNAKNLGVETVGGRKAWKLDVQISDATVRERSGYARFLRWVDTESLQTLRVEIFNAKNERIKTSAVELVQSQGFWLLGHMTVTLVRDDGKEEQTQITISGYRLQPQHLDFENLFSIRTLERGVPLNLQNEILKGSNP